MRQATTTSLCFDPPGKLSDLPHHTEDANGADPRNAAICCTALHLYTAGAAEAAPSNNGYGCMMLSETHTGTRAALSMHAVGIVLLAL